MYCCKLACTGGSRRLPLLSLAVLAAAAIVAGDVGETHINEIPAPAGAEAVGFEAEDAINRANNGLEISYSPDAPVPVPLDAIPELAEEDVESETSIEQVGADKAHEGETIPLVLNNGLTVGEMQRPALDRPKRKLRGVKTMIISMAAFLIALAMKPAGSISAGEKLALTFAFVGLARFLHSLFSNQPEYQFSVLLKTDKTSGQEQGVLEYGGLADTKHSAVKKFRDALLSFLVAIPTFFLVSGLMITLGYAATVASSFAIILSVVALLGALGAGAGGMLADLFKNF